MSELKLVLSVDSSQAEAALAGVPDAAERANRRILAGVAGRGQRDYQGSRTQYSGMAGMQGQIEKDIQKQAEAEKKAAEEVEKQNREKYEAELKWNSKLQQDKDKFLAEQEKAGLNKYEAELKWNSKLQEDADKAAAAEQKAANKKYEESLKFNSKVQEDQDKAEAERLKAEEEARKKEEAEIEAWHRKELARKLKELADQRKAEEKAAKDRQGELDKQASDAESWSSKFMSNIFQGMGLGAGFGLFKAFGNIGGIIKDSFREAIVKGESYSKAEATYQINPRDMFEAYMTLKNTSGMEEEEARAMGQRAASMAQDVAYKTSGVGKQAFEYFGMRDFESIKTEGFQFNEFLAKMSAKYKESGSTIQFRQFAKEIFGEDWKKLIPALAAGPEAIGTGTYVTLESAPAKSPMAAGLRAVNAFRMMRGQKPISSLEGGGEGGVGMPMMTPVTSIQAMGGGDILSATNRGPMDNIAKATQQTAENTAIMAGKGKEGPIMSSINGILNIIK